MCMAKETKSSPSEGSNYCSNWLEGWSIAQLRDWQDKDPDISSVKSWLRQYEEEVVASESAMSKAYWAQWHTLVIDNDVIYRLHKPHKHGDLPPVRQLVAPGKLKQEILHHLHTLRVAGHLGIKRTIENVRNRFYWPGYKKDVALWCEKCDVCAQKKSGPPRRKAPLSQEPIGAPMERVAMDIIGPLPMTESGNQYILLVGDYFTKWMEEFALPNHTAQTVAETFVEQIVCRFGAPRELHTDQGADFESNFMHAVCSLLGIRKTRTTPYRPQSDVLIERFN